VIDGQLAAHRVPEVFPQQPALALLRPQLAHGQEAGQPPVGLAIRGVDQQFGRLVREHQPTAGQGADRLAVLLPQGARLRPGPHHAGERVAVADADRLKAERRGADHELARV
jgi:hypothetical protein